MVEIVAKLVAKMVAKPVAKIFVKRPGSMSVLRFIHPFVDYAQAPQEHKPQSGYTCEKGLGFSPVFSLTHRGGSVR
ncbi:hypothetical protein GYMLUDRAFT_247909 [Collybiopsis luxurians FD-317 M1]|uniref:Uncharacterized protein n=1 Tax=Collybiopsis luxurians FD-317 M1 TaxID=944289 RepID=A0A0D0CED9_9AGAR|nr:hypothetical protein GYMLUDRAFT_247909 [Collybiopsis luxurians FD-317 M1]